MIFFKYLIMAVAFLSAGVANSTPVEYKVIAFFYEPATSNAPVTVPTHFKKDGTFVDAPFKMRGYTKFDGTFKWDSATNIISGLQGTQNESMYTPEEYPDISLKYQLAQSVNGDIVTATVFKEPTTDVFQGGGYQKGDMFYYGFRDGNERNYNAYFTLVFDKTTMQPKVWDLVYGDCTPGGMMGAFCMTGHSEIGTMNAWPIYAEISTISSVPVPAAFWLLGSSLLALLGFGRRTVKAA